VIGLIVLAAGVTPVATGVAATVVGVLGFVLILCGAESHEGTGTARWPWEPRVGEMGLLRVSHASHHRGGGRGRRCD
jgi:hypothetical protein